MDDVQQIIERLPSPSTMGTFARLRLDGWTWEDIENRMEGLTDDIAQSGMPFSDEADRYVRRLLLAAHAYEVEGQNN